MSGIEDPEAKPAIEPVNARNQTCDGKPFAIGSHVETLRDFEVNGSSIKKAAIGKITEAVNCEDGVDTLRVAFYTQLCGKQEISLRSEYWHYLVVIDEPANIVRTMIIVTSIVFLFLYGIVNEKQVSNQLEHLVHWCRTLGLWAPVLICIISTVLPVIMLPVFPVMALSGPLFTEMYDGDALFGGAVAFMSVFSGLWLGSVIVFALGKYLFQEWAAKAGRSNNLLKRINRLVASGGIKIVFMARSLPILPAEVFDYACALTDLQVWQYGIGCFGSSVPVAFWTFSSAQAAVVANEGASASTTHHVVLIVINMIALLLLTLALVYTIKQQEPESTSSNCGGHEDVSLMSCVHVGDDFDEDKLLPCMSSRVLNRSHSQTRLHDMSCSL